MNTDTRDKIIDKFEWYKNYLNDCNSVVNHAAAILVLAEIVEDIFPHEHNHEK